MKLSGLILSCLFIGFCCSSAVAQAWEKGIPGKLPKPPFSGALPAFPAKPKIPYLEELKQTRSLKQSYDSLRNELKELKDASPDSARRDSLFSAAKAKSREILERESNTLEQLIRKEDIPGEELKNAATVTLERVRDSQSELEKIKEVAALESLVDRNNENLKALTNEWVMPKIEEQLTGMAKEGFDPTTTALPDFYGKDALAELTENGLPSEIPYEQAKELAKEKALHISDEYIRKAGREFSKLKIDSLGNIKEIPPEVKKLKLVEPDQYKGDPFVQRTGMLLWYDPLISFGEGLLLDFGLSCSVSRQLAVVGGITWKKQFDKNEKLRREGTGMFSGVRFSKGDWFVQGTVNRNRVTVTNPAGYGSRDFGGKAWASNLAVGRIIPLGRTFRSVVMGSVAPFFDQRSSFYKSRFRLKIGFEIGSFRRTGKEVKELVPMDGLEDKGNEKVEYYLKGAEDL